MRVANQPQALDNPPQTSDNLQLGEFYQGGKGKLKMIKSNVNIQSL